MIVIEKIRKVILWFLFRIRKLRIQTRKKPVITTDRKIPLESLGTQYGGWKVPVGYLHKDSICYFAGAGIDLSFDVEVAKKYGSRVQIIDPTPVAKEHFELLLELTRKGEQFEIDRKRGQFYQANPETLELLDYHNIGLWGEDTTVKFYEPSNNKTMVSHSIVNLHGTDSYFEAEVVKLSTLMSRLGHSHIDYLKIDIEGAEYEVIQSIVRDELDVRVMGIEFDEVHHPLDRYSNRRIEEAIRQLTNIGFLVVDVARNYNVTLMKSQVLKDLYE